jgi:predicted DNA-binding transcriptional regulator AlpA
MTELCELMMLSRQTVDKRIRACKMPKPVDRGRERLFDRAEIYRFLNVDTDAKDTEPEENPWARGARIMAESMRAEAAKKAAMKIARGSENPISKSK